MLLQSTTPLQNHADKIKASVSTGWLMITAPVPVPSLPTMYLWTVSVNPRLSENGGERLPVSTPDWLFCGFQIDLRGVAVNRNLGSEGPRQIGESLEDVVRLVAGRGLR